MSLAERVERVKLTSQDTPWDGPIPESPEYTAFLEGTLFQHDPWNRLPQQTLKFLLQLLEPQTTRRLTIAQVLRHPWLNEQKQLEVDSVQSAEVAGLLLEGLENAGDLGICRGQVADER